MIYGLTNKETGEVRYVGRTSRSLNLRLNEHRSDARTGEKNSPLVKWIRLINPCNVDTLVLEKSDSNDTKAEVWWVEYMEFLGFNLLNVVRREMPIRDPKDGIDVTDEMKEMMGSVPDTKIAEKFGIGESTVYKHRTRLGIEGWSSKIELPKKCIEQLGEKPDAKLAEEFGVSKMTMANRREERNIESFEKQNVDVPEKCLTLLGKVPDTRLAERFNLTVDIVRNRRVNRGIEPAVDKSYIEIPVEELGTKPDNVLGEEYDVSPRTVCERRKEYGIESYMRQNWLSDEKISEVKWLAENAGDMSYEEIGNRYGISGGNVSATKYERRRANVKSVKPNWFKEQAGKPNV